MLDRDLFVLGLLQACSAWPPNHRSPSILAVNVDDNIAEPLETDAHH